MGKGKKMAGGSFMSKHAKNLLNYMPIDDKASALQYKGKTMKASPLEAHKEGHKPQLPEGYKGTKRANVGGINVSMRDSYGGQTKNYDLLDAPKDAYNYIKKKAKQFKAKGNPDNWLS